MRIDPTNGSAVRIATLNVGTGSALAYDAANNILYAASSDIDALYRINRVTGNVTLVGSFHRSGINSVMHGLEFYSPGNTLLGIDWRDKALVNIDPLTGAGTMIGVTRLSGFGSIAWDADAGKLWGADATTRWLWEIDPTSGASTPIGRLNVPARAVGTAMAWSPTYGLLALANQGDGGLYSIDTTTGQATLIGFTGTSNMISLVVVPEPAGLFCARALVCIWYSVPAFCIEPVNSQLSWFMWHASGPVSRAPRGRGWAEVGRGWRCRGPM